MSVLAWIVLEGLAMSAVALVGAFTLLLREPTRKRLVRPLIAFAAGSLLGGALFHLLPEAVARARPGSLLPYAWLVAGFLLFFVLEQFLHWHHCQRQDRDHTCPRDADPLSWLILIADGLHNFMGGLAVAGAFIADIRLGITAWLVAAAHEVPQELGDFGVLVHSGLRPARALTYNVLSALTFLVGGLVAYAVSTKTTVDFLLPLAAGNFLYIAASDLVPEVNRHAQLRDAAVHFVAFALGLALVLAAHAIPGAP